MPWISPNGIHNKVAAYRFIEARISLRTRNSNHQFTRSSQIFIFVVLHKLANKISSSHSSLEAIRVVLHILEFCVSSVSSSDVEYTSASTFKAIDQISQISIISTLRHSSPQLYITTNNSSPSLPTATCNYGRPQLASHD
ncbi:hypothetical protein DPSP01_001941 [Paraphaeosphaeria sporulosa]